MNKVYKVLTLDILDNEYIKWMKDYGISRNEVSLRFGQYIHSKYELNFPKDMNTSKDGFYDENPIDSYSKLMIAVK